MFNPNDEDEMVEMRDDALDLYNSFKKEQEMIKKGDGKIAEQVSLSHKAACQTVNNTILNSAGSSDTMSAGI